MKKILKSLKLRVMLLAMLIGITLQLGLSTDSLSASCENCVVLSGGLCVGCVESPGGFPSCIPIQETCSCHVTPGTCILD